MSLVNLVKFYRSFSHEEKEYDKGSYAFTVSSDYSSKVKDKFLPLIFKNNYADIVSLLVNSSCVDINSLPNPNDDESFELTVMVRASSSTSFYWDFHEFFKRNKHSILDKNCIPNQYYLVTEDYFPEDEKPLKQLVILDNILSVIDKLKQLAYFRDNNQGKLTLLFLNGANNASSPLEMQISLSENLWLLDPNMDFTLLHCICEDDSSDLQLIEKRSIFISSLIDFLTEYTKDVRFQYLIEHWNDFVDVFQKNLDSYLSNFSFHKIRQDIAEGQIRASNRFSELLTNIQGKLFGIPVSLAAITPLIDQGKEIPWGNLFLLFLGILLTSFIVFSVVRTQLKRFEIASKANENEFSYHEPTDYPENIADLLDEANSEINKQKKHTRMYLWFFMFLSWIPTVFFLGILLYQHN